MRYVLRLLLKRSRLQFSQLIGCQTEQSSAFRLFTFQVQM